MYICISNMVSFLEQIWQEAAISHLQKFLFKKNDNFFSVDLFVFKG